ncbi:MAG: RNA-binding domain-containing protein [Salinirussus sp.]
MTDIDVEITAPVHPTEREDLVAAAIESIFPDATPEYGHGELTARVDDLAHFSELLHRQEILDTARSVFFENRRGDAFSFRLRKGPALEGVVNFPADEGNELGDIAVRVRVSDPDVETYIDSIAPPTEGGEPIDI